MQVLYLLQITSKAMVAEKKTQFELRIHPCTSLAEINWPPCFWHFVYRLLIYSKRCIAFCISCFQFFFKQVFLHHHTLLKTFFQLLCYCISITLPLMLFTVNFWDKHITEYFVSWSNIVDKEYSRKIWPLVLSKFSKQFWGL